MKPPRPAVSFTSYAASGTRTEIDPHPWFEAVATEEPARDGVYTGTIPLPFEHQRPRPAPAPPAQVSAPSPDVDSVMRDMRAAPTDPAMFVSTTTTTDSRSAPSSASAAPPPTRNMHGWMRGPEITIAPTTVATIRRAPRRIELGPLHLAIILMLGIGTMLAGFVAARVVTSTAIAAPSYGK